MSDQHRGHPTDRSRTLGFVFIVIAVIMVVQGVWLQYDQARESSCQSEYNADVSAVVAQRSTWADEDRRELNNMIFKIIDPKASDPEQAAAVKKYVTTAKANDALRKANPMPAKTDC